MTSPPSPLFREMPPTARSRAMSQKGKQCSESSGVESPFPSHTRQDFFPAHTVPYNHFVEWGTSSSSKRCTEKRRAWVVFLSLSAGYRVGETEGTVYRRVRSLVCDLKLS